MFAGLGLLQDTGSSLFDVLAGRNFRVQFHDHAGPQDCKHQVEKSKNDVLSACGAGGQQERGNGRIRTADLLSAVRLTADRKRIWLPGTDSNRRPSD